MALLDILVCWFVCLELSHIVLCKERVWPCLLQPSCIQVPEYLIVFNQLNIVNQKGRIMAKKLTVERISIYAGTKCEKESSGC